MNSRSILDSIVTELKGHNKMPKRIDFSKIGDRYWCVVSDNATDTLSVINEDVFTGFSNEKEVALLKALSERAERLAFIEGSKTGIQGCQTERSDGFAAMPLTSSAGAVRGNALNEAIERYAWSTWWDDTGSSFTIQTIHPDDKLVQSIRYLQEVIKTLNFEFLYVVSPAIDNAAKEVQILIGKIKDKGYVSGGACGSTEETQTTFLRALDELYRHGFAVQRAIQKGIESNSLYEKRLMYFASGLGNKLVEERLAAQGIKVISLPKLQVDLEIESQIPGFTVHRCYFENQPPFVGGAMERFCL